MMIANVKNQARPISCIVGCDPNSYPSRGAIKRKTFGRNKSNERAGGHMHSQSVVKNVMKNPITNESASTNQGGVFKWQ